MVQADSFGRMVQLSPTTLNISLEGAQVEEPVTLILECFPLEQLYALQKEVQQEIQFHEEIVHDEMQMVDIDYAHYMDLCAMLKK